MITLTRDIKNKLTFAVVFVFFFCALLAFATEVRANGNISADVPPEPPMQKSVRRAPIRRAPQKAPVQAASEPAAQNVQNTQERPITGQPVSLETGIRLMEQERYKQAHDWLQKAVQEERENPYAWYWYGMAHDKLGQYSQAQFFYAKALELDPAFPPFSRVLAYPDDGDRKALWDPRRPARVYPIELGDRNVMIVPPGSAETTFRQPVPDVDPTLPRVPVYVPPDVPSAAGDAVQPPVYVPPNFAGDAAVYSPPGVTVVTPGYTQLPVSEIEAPVYTPPPPPR